MIKIEDLSKVSEEDMIDAPLDLQMAALTIQNEALKIGAHSQGAPSLALLAFIRAYNATLTNELAIQLVHAFSPRGALSAKIRRVQAYVAAFVAGRIDWDKCVAEATKALAPLTTAMPSHTHGAATAARQALRGPLQNLARDFLENNNDLLGLEPFKIDAADLAKAVKDVKKGDST